MENPYESKSNIIQAEIIADYLRRSEVTFTPEAWTPNGTMAGYSKKYDQIRIRPIEKFRDADQYFSVLFHEVAHSTGHPKRLNRPGIGARPYSLTYLFEELIAELTSAFLDVEVGVSSTIEDHSYYQKKIITAIAAGPLTIMRAAEYAQDATDMILGCESQAAHEACDLIDEIAS